MKRKALFILASKDFKDEEYFVSREILESACFEIAIAGDVKGLAIGVDGGEVESEMSLDEVTVDNLDVLLFIGGPGCLRHLDNEKSYRITREAFSKGVMLAAICISPVILAKAGLLNGKEATVWTGPMDRSAVNVLEDHGAKFRDENVVVDDGVITGKGPSSAVLFGKTIDREVKKR